MENRLDTLNQYKSEIFELKKKLAEKEAEYLDVGKEMFEQDTGWEFGKTVLTNKNGPVKLKILLNFVELQDGEFTAIGNVINKNGWISRQQRIITVDGYEDARYQISPEYSSIETAEEFIRLSAGNPDIHIVGIRQAQEVSGKTVWKPVKTVLKGSKNAE